MAVKIDSEIFCGHIENCPVQGLCVKICEQGALIEEDGDVTIVPENAMTVTFVFKTVLIKLYLKHEGFYV